jgi:hypothetical protein
MLNSVSVASPSGALLTMLLDDPSSGLLIDKIEGLDPVKATLVSSSFAQMDGEQFHSSRREPRNIKLTIDLEPDYVVDTVQDLRTRLYNFFMPKSKANLTFTRSDAANVTIEGYVETFETPLFTKEPAVDISIMCFDPDFLDPNAKHVAGSTTATTVETPITYDGTVDTGGELTINVNRVLTSFSVYMRPANGLLQQMDFNIALQAGDVVKVSTVPGQKYVRLTRAGVTTSILYALNPQSAWFNLQPGVNNFRVYAVGAGVPFDLMYYNRYGGL